MMKTPYRHYMDALSKYVDPKIAQLPPIKDKRYALTEICEFVRKCPPPTLYRYMPVTLNALLGIINQDVYLMEAAKMNDIFEGSAYSRHPDKILTKDAVEKAQHNLFLKSFSYDPINILMWSHYGDENKGICIGYNFSQASSEVKKHLYPVQYSNKRFSFESVKKSPENAFLLLRKSSCWKYEKEFRLIYECNEFSNDNHCISLKDCVSEITFGLRTETPQINFIKYLVNTIYPDIQLYQIKTNENSFRLTREKI